jgi:aminodeoxyfutalosine deaminase
MAEIRDRGIVLDVCPVSNLRTRAVASLQEHPLPKLVGFGIPCSISTDDPEMFDTDLSREYEVATSFGISPSAFYEAGLRGALCDAQTREVLEGIGRDHQWPTASIQVPGTQQAEGSPD